MTATKFLKRHIHQNKRKNIGSVKDEVQHHNIFHSQGFYNDEGMIKLAVKSFK